ncbi:MAG TPA: PepSY-associated TM helix domain-containing protein [Steroidobacteraceae bacterium]|jgi:uncharacterized iron-regulated membrane protein
MIRRAFFQVHLWSGLASGLYILAICLSGSAIIFRREMNRAFCGKSCEPRFVTGLAEFHDHLLGGRSGLLVNGIGALVVALMIVTGVVLWWPRRGYWLRSITIRTGVSARRFNRELHNALGFWLLIFIVMWVVTALYFAFPNAFSEMDDDIVAAAVRLHFGRAYGLTAKILWAVLGLGPCVLFITGALMWWHRSGEKKWQTMRNRATVL